jgi:hypothetical protein
MGTKRMDMGWVKGRRYTPYPLKYLGGYTLLDILEWVVVYTFKSSPEVCTPYIKLLDSIRRKKS